VKNIIYTRKEIKYLLANITFMSSLFDLGSLIISGELVWVRCQWPVWLLSQVGLSCAGYFI